MRKLAIALAVVVGLLAIAAGVIYYTFDPQRMRGVISLRLEATLGRKVTLGDLKLGLFPPSLYVSNAQIAEALGFSDPVFSSAKTFQLRVRLIPLVRGRVEVPSIEMDQPVIHLVKNPRGEWNFATLGETGAATSGAKPSPAEGELQRPLQIEDFELRDGTVTVDDLQKKTPRVTLDHINVSVKNFVPSQPFDWTASVHPPGPDSSTVQASGRGGPLTQKNLAASPANGHVVFRNVSLQALAPFTGQPGLGGLFDGEADFSSNGSQAQAKGTYKVDKLRLAANGGTALAPVSGRFDVSMPEDASHLQIRQFDASCGKAALNSTGQLTFGPHPEADIRSNINAAPLADIAKLFPLFGVRLPAHSSITEGTLTAALRAFGPSAALKRSGTLDIRNARLAGYSVAGQLGSALRLMGIDSGGRDTAIESLHLAFEGDPAYTRVSEALLKIPGMDVSANGGFSEPGALDFRGSVVMTRAAAAVSSLLQKATGSGNSVPFRLAGTFENPSFTPDVGKIVNQQLGQQLNKQLGKEGNPADQLLKGLGGLFNKKK